jgi:hypothetical protein
MSGLVGSAMIARTSECLLISPVCFDLPLCIYITRYLRNTKTRRNLQATPMVLPAHKTPMPSPAPREPDQVLPKMPSRPATETHPGPIASHAEISSPAEPFPEFDFELEAEPNPSPTFAHEAEVHTSPGDLSLPAPALNQTRELETGAVVSARVTWAEVRESEEERGDMREATARALEWARKMFGKEGFRA